MNTTQRKAIIAFTTLNGMGKKPMPTTTAYKLFKIKRALKDVIDFQAEQEIKLAEEHGVTISQEGRFEYKDAETRAKFEKAHAEMEQSECEIDLTPQKITGKELPEITINEIEALDGFVEFQ